MAKKSESELVGFIKSTSGGDVTFTNVNKIAQMVCHNDGTVSLIFGEPDGKCTEQILMGDEANEAYRRMELHYEQTGKGKIKIEDE